MSTTVIAVPAVFFNVYHYANMKSSSSEFITVRGLQYHIRQWGNAGSPQLVMLHGWMDVSASFQFMIDSLASDWHIIAPDWRGFGLTDGAGADTYWFPDYLADLDAILDHYAPDGAVNLIGHSMGGNVATLYAGVRPQRVKRLVNLEGFGMPVTRAEQAPERYASWLDGLREPEVVRTYASLVTVADRLKKNNPRLNDERAEFLASHWAAQNADGEWVILGDPAHKKHSPILYRVDEAMACWSKISAPVLWVEADDTNIWRWLGPQDQTRDEIDRRINFIPDVSKALIKDAGHMLHHDQPQVLAAMIERFVQD